MSHDTNLVPATDSERFPVDNPGIEHHVERYTDADAAAGNRAYRQVLFIFGLVPLLALINVVVYFAVPRTATMELFGEPMFVQLLLMGLTGGLAVLLIGVGAIHWARQLMSDVEISEERHPAASSPQDHEELFAKLSAGVADSGVSRRKMILSALGGALGIIALPPVVMLLDAGPWPTDAVRKETLEKTVWAEGVRLVNDVNYKPLRASDLEIGQLVNAEPENITKLHGAEFQIAKTKAAISVIWAAPIQTSAMRARCSSSACW